MSDITIHTKTTIKREMSITVESLIEKFIRDNCPTPDECTVTRNFDFSGVPSIKLVWEIDKATLLAEDEPEPEPEPVYDSTHKVYPVATGDLRVGDVVMVRDSVYAPWVGPRVLEGIDQNAECKYRTDTRFGWSFARHLTDEERAQIKRI